MKTEIMKKLLFCVLLLFFGHFSFGQTYLIQLKADGQAIPEANKLQKANVVWSVTDAAGRIANDVDVYAMGMGDFKSNKLMFDINFWYPAPNVGTTITITITVKSGPLAGYSGAKDYIINGGNVDDFLPDGINLVKRASFCHFQTTDKSEIASRCDDRRD